MFFAVWKHAPLKTTLLRELEEACDVTYREFEDPEELRGDLQHFFHCVADRNTKAAATPLVRALGMTMPDRTQQILIPAVAEKSRQVVYPAPVAAPTSGKADDAAQVEERLAAAAQKLGDVINLTEVAAGRTSVLALDATIQEVHRRNRQATRRSR
jgi:hypothetical protein